MRKIVALVALIMIVLMMMALGLRVGLILTVPMSRKERWGIASLQDGWQLLG
jgi:hypothetical protein